MENQSDVPMEGVSDSNEQSFEEKVHAEIERFQSMKIGDLKMKLQAKGILTSTFCEKSEFVRAYAEATVRGTEGSAMKVETAEEEDEDDEAMDDDEGEPQEFFEQLPSSVKRRVAKLKELNDERQKQVAQYYAERAQLEAKYQSLAAPLFEKRAEIVLGKMDSQIAAGHEEEENESGEEEKADGIPQFWVLAIAHMDVVAELLTEADIQCLESLQDVACKDDESGAGFTLSFTFAENDYFEETVLTKRYDVPNLHSADEPILKHVEGCAITWKAGKSLTFTETTKQQRGTGKNAGQVRTVTQKKKQDSFFHFFTAPELPSMESMDEEEAVRLEQAFNSDFDVAQAFRSQIIPKAVLWYTGHALEQEMEAAMGGLKWPQGAAPGGDENPECKQS